MSADADGTDVHDRRSHHGIDERFLPRDPASPGAVPPGWVRVDFHMHTYGSGDAVTTVEEFAEAVEASSLDVVCVTDHNAVHIAHELAPALEADLDVRVVVGEEIKTHEGELIGLFLRERVSFGMPAHEAAASVRAQGGVTYVPHPIGPRNHAMSADAMLGLCRAGLLDGIEVFNARNTFEAANRAAAEFATEHDLAAGAGSDAHYPDEIGAAWLVMPDFDSPEEFVASMRHGYVVGRRHDPTRSTWKPRIIPPSSPA